MKQIFRRKKTVRIIEIVEQLTTKKKELLCRQKELDTVLTKTNFERDKLIVFGEIDEDKINGYTPRIKIRGGIKREILIHLLHEDIISLKNQIEELETSLI